MQTLKAGDHVTLTSGGPVMVVNAMHGDKAELVRLDTTTVMLHAATLRLEKACCYCAGECDGGGTHATSGRQICGDCCAGIVYDVAEYAIKGAIEFKTYRCVYCKTSMTSPGLPAIHAHMLVCSAHPMRAVERELAELKREQAGERAADALRRDAAADRETS